MRRRLAVSLVVASIGGGLGLVPGAGLAQAQQPRARAVAGGYARTVSAEDDPIRPYTEGAAASASGSRGYYRSYARPAPVARPPARPQSVRDYYPTMRTGQGPNRNVVDPRTLCVPGRRAMLMMTQAQSLGAGSYGMPGMPGTSMPMMTPSPGARPSPR
jgi:hypothetical protein